jgi:hypothetical protein
MCSGLYRGWDLSENVHQDHQTDLLKHCLFACSQSVIKHTLLEEHCNFSAVSEIPLERFSTKCTSGAPLKFATNDQELRRLCSENKVLCQLYLGVNWRDFPET